MVTALTGDNVTLGGNAVGSFADKNVATGKAVSVTGLTLSGADAGNYTLVAPAGLSANISQVNLSVIGLAASDKTYDGTTSVVLTGTATVAARSGDSVSVGGTASGSFATNKNVHTGKAVSVTGSTLSGTDASNYNLVQQTGLTATISPASVTLSTGNVSKTYDATLNAVGSAVVSVGTLYSGDTLSGGSFAYTDKNVGAGNKTVNVSGVILNDGNSGGNYTVSYASNTTSTISAASLTVGGLSASNKVYDATTTATLTGTATVTALGSDVLTLGGTAAGAFADKNVGTGKTVTVTGKTLGGADAGNYTLLQQSGLSADISQADLAVTGLTTANRAYNASAVATLGGTAAVTKLGTDDVTLGGTASGAFADKNVGTGKTVTVIGNTPVSYTHLTLPTN